VDQYSAWQYTDEWLVKVNEVRPSRAHGEIPASLLPLEQAAFTPLKETPENYGLFHFVTPNREGRVWVEGTRHQVPIGYAGSVLILRMRSCRLDFYQGDNLVASYPRAKGVAAKCGVVLFEPEQLEPLLAERPRARVMVYRDYLVQQHDLVAAYVMGLCSRHRGDERFGPHILRMFDLLRIHGTDSVAAACSLASEQSAYGVEYLEGLLMPAVVRPQPASTLTLPGVPEQSMVDRDLSTYEDYALGGYHA
jgi:hypothetical protein